MRANAAANYASLAFSMAATVVVLPIYLRLMGAEAFGLVGVFTLLNAAFQVFDAGLAQTFARECARYTGGARDLAGLRRLLITFEIVFFLAAAAGAVAFALAAPLIAGHWLRAARLSAAEISRAIALMGLAITGQWVSGLYRGVLIGLERQVSLAVFNVAVAAARVFGAIAVLACTRGDPIAFFAWQAALSGVELATAFALARRALRSPAGADAIAPKLPPRRPLPWGEFRGLLRFSGGVAFTAVSWLVLMQGDKLILSRVLSLADYGIFTLAVTASSAVAGLGAPIAQAILPRLTGLHISGRADPALGLYSLSTQATCLVAMTAAVTLAAFAQPFFLIWTGDARLARQAAPILTAYVLGGGFATLAAFPYYLQYAAGALRLHLIGQVLTLAVLVPALIVAAHRWGAVGTGVVWTATMLVYLLLWSPVVHGRFAPALRTAWLTRDIVPMVGASGAAALGLALLLRWPANRFGAAAELGGAWLAVAAAAALASSAVMSRVLKRPMWRGPASP